MDVEATEGLVLCELEKGECAVLRGLWEEVFSEDTDAFTDYYFKEKVIRNHAFALYTDKSYLSMLHLSPYEMMMRTGRGFQCREINYIVGVATKERYRHKGYMDWLLRTAFKYMFQKQQPFTFLMPASPKIYEPYQFVYIYDREEFEIKEILSGHMLTEAEIPQMTAFASSYLEKEKDVFIRRSKEYFEVLIKELRAQNGGIYPVYEKERIVGYYLYAQEAGAGEIQEAVIRNDNSSCPVFFSGKKTPIIMARIVNVKVMLEMLSALQEEIILTVRVLDNMIGENDGIWQWRISSTESCIQQIEQSFDTEAKADTNSKIDCMISIDRLTAWIFGYAKTEECFQITDNRSKKEQMEVLCKLKNVRTFKDVFINEIV